MEKILDQGILILPRRNQREIRLKEKTVGRRDIGAQNRDISWLIQRNSSLTQSGPRIDTKSRGKT